MRIWSFSFFLVFVLGVLQRIINFIVILNWNLLEWKCLRLLYDVVRVWVFHVLAILRYLIRRLNRVLVVTGLLHFYFMINNLQWASGMPLAFSLVIVVTTVVFQKFSSTITFAELIRHIDFSKLLLWTLQHFHWPVILPRLIKVAAVTKRQLLHINEASYLIIIWD